MKRMRAELMENEEVTTFFALESLELRKSRNGQKYFLTLNLGDKTGNIRGYLWEDPQRVLPALRAKSLVKVKGITKMVNGSLAINVEKIRPADEAEIDMGDFLEVVTGGIGPIEHRLERAIDLIENADCRRLIGSFLRDKQFYEKFVSVPAGVTVHHGYIGGLLEHTAGVMELAVQIADKCPWLVDRDMLVTGAFLHDIGKTLELRYETVREYTTEGRLLGHVLIGITMIGEKLRGLADFPESLATALKHMVISHHGEAEYGSPVRPATPEAVALHMIDNIDAKLNHLTHYLGNSNREAEWSGFDRFLNTEIFQASLTRKQVLMDQKNN